MDLMDVVYADLPDCDLNIDVKKLQDDNLSLQTHINHINNEILKLHDEINCCKQINGNLNKNIAKLYVTAINVIDTKNEFIKKLQTHLDDLICGRNTATVVGKNDNNNRSCQSLKRNLLLDDCDNNKSSSQPEIKRARSDNLNKFGGNSTTTTNTNQQSSNYALRKNLNQTNNNRQQQQQNNRLEGFNKIQNNRFGYSNQLEIEIITKKDKSQEQQIKNNKSTTTNNQKLQETVEKNKKEEPNRNVINKKLETSQRNNNNLTKYEEIEKNLENLHKPTINYVDDKLIDEELIIKTEDLSEEVLEIEIEAKNDLNKRKSISLDNDLTFESVSINKLNVNKEIDLKEIEKNTTTTRNRKRKSTSPIKRKVKTSENKKDDSVNKSKGKVDKKSITPPTQHYKIKFASSSKKKTVKFVDEIDKKQLENNTNEQLTINDKESEIEIITDVKIKENDSKTVNSRNLFENQNSRNELELENNKTKTRVVNKNNKLRGVGTRRSQSNKVDNKINKTIDEKSREEAGEVNNKSHDEKIDGINKKDDDKLNKEVNDKIEEKNDSKTCETDNKINTKVDEKINDKSNEKANNKINKTLNQKVESKNTGTIKNISDILLKNAENDAKNKENSIEENKQIHVVNNLFDNSIKTSQTIETGEIKHNKTIVDENIVKTEQIVNTSTENLNQKQAKVCRESKTDTITSEKADDKLITKSNVKMNEKVDDKINKLVETETVEKSNVEDDSNPTLTYLTDSKTTNNKNELKNKCTNTKQLKNVVDELKLSKKCKTTNLKASKKTNKQKTCTSTSTTNKINTPKNDSQYKNYKKQIIKDLEKVNVSQTNTNKPKTRTLRNTIGKKPRRISYFYESDTSSDESINGRASSIHSDVSVELRFPLSPFKDDSRIDEQDLSISTSILKDNQFDENKVVTSTPSVIKLPTESKVIELETNQSVSLVNKTVSNNTTNLSVSTNSFQVRKRPRCIMSMKD